MRIKSADHLRGRGNIKGCASVRPNTVFWTPLWDLARTDLADRRLNHRRFIRLVGLGKATRFPLETRVWAMRRSSRQGVVPSRN